MRDLTSSSGDTSLITLIAPDYTNLIALVTGVAVDMQIPAGANWVNIASAGNYYVRFSQDSSGAPTIPASLTPTVLGDGSEYGVTLRRLLKTDDWLSIITSDTTTFPVTVTFYK